MNLTLFKYENTEIRMEEKDGKRWWIALDVCKILEIKNTTNALRNLHDDEKGLLEVNTLGGIQRLSCVTEPGLYKLIMKSKKPEAVAFQRWFTHEVLPSINKTGAYVAPTTSQVAQQMTPKVSLVAQAEMFLAMVKQQEALEAQVIETKQIAVEALEATKKDQGYLSILGFARKNNIYLKNGQASSIGKTLSNYCKENNIKYENVSDARWGKINVYPIDVLERNKSLFVSPV